MLLDRDLTPDLFDIALRIATSGEPWDQQRKLLTVALRDRVSAQEASGKTKKCLTRIWINPPRHAKPMICWATQHLDLSSDRRLFHLGALLATFPFAASVTAIIGRAIALEGRVEPLDVRRRAREQWGDKESVDVAARKVYTTLRAMGALRGGSRSALEASERLAVPAGLTLWLVHALLVGRGSSAIGLREIEAAPELFWASMSTPSDSYPLLQRHSEGLNRTVWSTC